MQTIRARHVQLSDFEDDTLSIPDQVLLWRNRHGDQETWDFAQIVDFIRPEIVAEDSEFSTINRLPTGDGRWFKKVGYVRVRSQYGAETQHPSRLLVATLAIPDPASAVELPLTPEYGTHAKVHLTVPGMSAAAVESMLNSALADHLPKAHVINMSASEVADRRVNVYANDAGVKGPLLFKHILEGEIEALVGFRSIITEPVSREEYEAELHVLSDAMARYESQLDQHEEDV